MGLTPSPMRLGLAASNLDPASSLDSKLRHGARQSGTCKRWLLRRKSSRAAEGLSSL